MAIKQTYTATATWTAAQLADLFRSAFIDAGYMVDWYDSFSSSGVENRLLEVAYNETKAFGKTYYWFKFTTAGCYIAFCTGWDATTHVPTGTLYLDYVSSTTSGTASHGQIVAMAPSVTTTLVRYTSTDAGAQTWFLVRHGSTVYIFNIEKADVTPNASFDYDKVMHSGWTSFGVGTSGITARISFYVNFGGIRRSAVGSTAFTANNASPAYVYNTYSYVAFGKTSIISNNLQDLGALGFFPLPVAFNSVNPAFTADQVPICTGMLTNTLSNQALPSDIGLIPHYTNNTMATQDRFIVSAGVEEWEILRTKNSSALAGEVSLAFAARIV